MPNFAINEDRCDFTLNGWSLGLTKREFDITKTLFENPNVVFNQEQLYSAIGLNTFVEKGTLAKHIANIRRRFDGASETNTGQVIIQTRRRIGYCWSECNHLCKTQEIGAK